MEVVVVEDSAAQSSAAASSQAPQGPLTLEAGEWTKAEFPPDYNISVDIQIPPNWGMRCCGDMDHASDHHFLPLASIDTGEPEITLTDFAMQMCPGVRYAGCNWEERVEATPAQFLQTLTAQLETGGEVGNTSGARKTGSVKLPNFAKQASVYTGVSRSGEPNIFYLVPMQDGVVMVTFHHPDRVEERLRSEFVARLR
jgi:hypothetical protein